MNSLRNYFRLRDLYRYSKHVEQQPFPQMWNSSRFHLINNKKVLLSNKLSKTQRPPKI